MTTELGRKLRKMAEDMSKASDGSHSTYESVADIRGLTDGTPLKAIKDLDGGLKAGWDHSLEALGARSQHGDQVDEDEIAILIERAKKLNIEYPEQTVRGEIQYWQRHTEASDKWYNKKK